MAADSPLGPLGHRRRADLNRPPPAGAHRYLSAVNDTAVPDLNDPATDPFEGARAAAAVIAERPAPTTTTSPSSWFRLGPDRRPHRRDARDHRQRRRPRLRQGGGRGPLGHHALRRDRRHRPASPGLRHADPLLRGPGGPLGGPRRAHGGRRRVHDDRPDQRVRRPEPRLASRHPRADPRPHQPDRALPHRGRELRRPDRPLLPGCAVAWPRESTPTSTRASTCSSAAPTTRPRPRCRWPRSSAATSWACPPTRGDRGPAGGHRGARHLPGDQPRRRHQRASPCPTPRSSRRVRQPPSAGQAARRRRGDNLRGPPR